MGDVRGLRPNGNDPATVPPATVGPPAAVPGDPSGVVLIDEGPGGRWGGAPPQVAAWSGYPAEWATPLWSMPGVPALVDVAWSAIDVNASITAAMPPYLVTPAASLDAGWLSNPDPDRYGSWEAFWYDVWWSFMAVGEAFLLATAFYASGYAARFHVVPAPLVDVELDDAGVRRYQLGGVDVTDRILHIRYRATTQDPHGAGPLEAAGTRLVAAGLLAAYVGNLMASGGVPTQVITHPEALTAAQIAELQDQWVQARMSTMGIPAVLSGGVQYTTPALNPKDLALLDLAQATEARIAIMLRVPPYMLALPQSGDSLVYNTAALTLDYHWRAHLRPLVRRVVAPMSQWLLPAGTSLELNRDDYVRMDPLGDAQRLTTLVGAGIMTVDEAREQMRLSTAAPSPTLTSAVLQ